MQAAEGCIKQVKLGLSRKTIKTGTPKPLWNHCSELEGGIRSLTALDIYGLQGQVPQTIMSGETTEISPYCEFRWFQWVMYYEPNAMYPDDKCYMGRWLGPAVDVGSSMTYTVQKSNSHFVCRTSVRPWTPEEEANPDLLREREEFMARLKDNLGRPAKEVDFPLEDLIPEYRRR